MTKKRKSANDAKIERETADLRAILEGLPANPVAWGAVLRMVAPFIARLAVRLALKKVKRDMSEEKVNAVAGTVSALLKGILGTTPRDVGGNGA